MAESTKPLEEESANAGRAYWTADVKEGWDPVGRIRLSNLMNYDRRASYRHKIVWEFHLGWSHAKYGHTSLASVRKIHDELAARAPDGKAPLAVRHISEATETFAGGDTCPNSKRAAAGAPPDFS